MGHIKLAKSGGQFDIVSADGVISVASGPDTKNITISYSTGAKCKVTCSKDIKEMDVFEVVKAIDVMDGTSGPAPLVNLSTEVSSTELVITAPGSGEVPRPE